jgi:hypothetical protein
VIDERVGYSVENSGKLLIIPAKAGIYFGAALMVGGDGGALLVIRGHILFGSTDMDGSVCRQGERTSSGIIPLLINWCCRERDRVWVATYYPLVMEQTRRYGRSIGRASGSNNSRLIIANIPADPNGRAVLSCPIEQQRATDECPPFEHANY